MEVAEGPVFEVLVPVFEVRDLVSDPAPVIEVRGPVFDPVPAIDPVRVVDMALTITITLIARDIMVVIAITDVHIEPIIMEEVIEGLLQLEQLFALLSSS